MNTTEPTVHAYDLGEEGEQWMVEGTLDAAEAEKAVRDLWAEQGVTDEYEFLITDDVQLQFTPREDWYWVPVSDEHPDEEANLRNLTEHSTDERAHGDMFTGVLVRL